MVSLHFVAFQFEMNTIAVKNKKTKKTHYAIIYKNSMKNLVHVTETGVEQMKYLWTGWKAMLVLRYNAAHVEACSTNQNVSYDSWN